MSRAFDMLQDVGNWHFADPHWLVPSQTHPREHYRVTPTSCSCDDFAYRGGSAGACKHMLSLRTLLAVRDAQRKENA